MEDLLTTDALGYTCVDEKDLDAAFQSQSKYSRIPQTCISEVPQKNCDSLEPLLGRKPTYDECVTHAIRWLSWFDPDKTLDWGWDCSAWDCTVPEPYTPPATVPSPVPIFLLTSGILVLGFIRRKQ